MAFRYEGKGFNTEDTEGHGESLAEPIALRTVRAPQNSLPQLFVTPRVKLTACVSLSRLRCAERAHFSCGRLENEESFFPHTQSARCPTCFS
jgi:hypothetical protein